MSLFGALSIDLVKDIEKVFPTFYRILTTEENVEFIRRQILHSHPYIILTCNEVRMFDYKYMGSDIVASRYSTEPDPLKRGVVTICIPLSSPVTREFNRRNDYEVTFENKGLEKVQESFWGEVLIAFGLSKRKFMIDRDDQLHQVRVIIANINYRLTYRDYVFEEREKIIKGNFVRETSNYWYRRRSRIKTY